MILVWFILYLRCPCDTHKAVQWAHVELGLKFFIMGSLHVSSKLCHFLALGSHLILLILSFFCHYNKDDSNAYLIWCCMD